MNNESLKQENSFLKEMIRTYYQPEVERLNNIINSMNDYLVMNIANAGLDFMYRQGFKDSYKKLQELKGSNNNE